MSKSCSIIAIFSERSEWASGHVAYPCKRDILEILHNHFISMDIVGVSYLGIILATVASYFVGFLWHGPVFGKYWVRMMGYTPEQMQSMRLTGTQAMLGGFVAQLVQVYVLAQFIMSMGAFSVVSALMLVGWLWLGFVALTQFGTVLWENRAPKLFAFNAAYQLVQLSVAAIVIVLIDLA